MSIDIVITPYISCRPSSPYTPYIPYIPRSGIVSIEVSRGGVGLGGGEGYGGVGEKA